MSMTDQRSWGRRKRIRFKEAVPLRRDRRDLRRQFRRAARATLAEQRAEMTALLQQLSADNVPLSEIVLRPEAGDGIVVFHDGTQLLFVARYGNAGMERLRERNRASQVPMRLVAARPSFTRCWFRLWFASACSTKLAEVQARVGPVPAGGFL